MGTIVHNTHQKRYNISLSVYKIHILLSLNGIGSTSNTIKNYNLLLKSHMYTVYRSCIVNEIRLLLHCSIVNKILKVPIVKKQSI